MERVRSDQDQDEGAALRQYTLAKQEVTTLVRATKQFFQAHQMQEATERCQDLIVQLAEDRFNLAVVGQFKRGKSSLMNAILGRDLLPTGLLPLTSAITTLCYGPTERVVLHRKRWAIEQEIPLAQLGDFITERGNPGNEKGLVEARVELPLPFLRRGLHFIDTPGIGSARRENTATTYAFLPQMAAVIFVTSVEAPLSEAEEHFLIDLRGHVRHLFVVVNKIDLLGDADREEVLTYVQARVVHLLGASIAHLAPLSARDGLTAKRNHDHAALHRSGLVPFEQVLATFLAEAQGRAFLVSMLDRTLRLFAEAGPMFPPTGAESEGEPSRSGLDLQQAMESLRASLQAGVPLAGACQTVHPPAPNPRVLEQALAAGRSPASGGERGHPNARLRTCPICAAQGQALFAFFARWQYTLSIDATAQRAFAAEHGMCPVHTWQFQEMASPPGMSDGYAPLIETLASELSHLLAQEEKRSAALATPLADTTTCVACRLVRETADKQVQQLLTSLAMASNRDAYASSTGLCLPHLQVALTHLEHDAGEEQRLLAEFLLREQVRHLENLADDLRNYALKRDALRRGRLNREEEQARRRALVQLVGERAARGGALMADSETV